MEPVRLTRNPGSGPPPTLDSQIVSEFPELFNEFRGNKWKLLWRGSRAGFSAADFHTNCDGHWNTITVIADVKWNVFGGFTPVPWEPRIWNRKFDEEDNRAKEDPSRESFLFTLKNPFNVPPTKFPLVAGAAPLAIRCDNTKGPSFGARQWGDIAVYDQCHSTNTSHTRGFGGSYHNTTQLDGRTFFTGTERFTAKEIEVFEISD
jgi:hypothetical protein